jgi:RNA polymerase sigma-70 factor (ECF subfamily)
VKPLEPDFDRLVRAHRDAVYRQMVRVCGNYDDAEDVLAEALSRAHAAMGSLRDEGAFRGWLAIIAKRLCARLRKKAAFQKLVYLAELEDVDEEAGEGGDPHAALSEKQLKACVSAALEGLGPGYREAYELRDLQGLDSEEAAARLGISVAALKSRLHRARVRVRKALDKGVGCADLFPSKS